MRVLEPIMTKETLSELEKRLWEIADNLRANSDLKSSEYSVPVLGLIFLKYSDSLLSAKNRALIKREHRL